jgi:hypothetical protein
MKNLPGFLFSSWEKLLSNHKSICLSQILFLTLLFGSCAPEKTSVSDLDIHKVIDRISYSRFADRLESDDSTKIKSDREIFLETCELYRLNPDLVLEKLQTANLPLYNRFKEKYEK